MSSRARQVAVLAMAALASAGAQEAQPGAALSQVRWSGQPVVVVPLLVVVERVKPAELGGERPLGVSRVTFNEGDSVLEAVFLVDASRRVLEFQLGGIRYTAHANEATPR